MVCDEAHRTTGGPLAGEDESNFVRIHDPGYVRAARRLYMTVTPRIYDQSAKGQAEEHSAEVTSVDNEADYGPEFYRVPFGEAVDAGLLTDYKVLVLTVDESVIAGPLQLQPAAEGSELQLTSARSAPTNTSAMGQQSRAVAGRPATPATREPVTRR